MTARRIPLSALTAALSLAACTVEHTKTLGAACLVNRDCAEGLVCLQHGDGTQRCEAPLDAQPFGTRDAAADATVGDVGADGATPDGADDVTSTDGADAADVVTDPDVHVRVANLITSGGHLPPVDVCVRPSGAATFTGPVLRGAGIAGGLGANQVSTYLPVPAGSYDLVVVAASATDCATPLLPVQMGLDAGAAGTYATLALYGLPPVGDAGGASTTFRASVLRDHDPTMAGANPLLRLFHAVPVAGLRFDLGLLMGTPPSQVFIEVFEDIGFGELGRSPMATPGTVDAEGYFSGMPLTGVSVGARATCMGATPCSNPVLFHVDGIDVPANAYLSAFLTVGTAGANAGMPAALVCMDTAPPASGLTQCALLPP